MTQQLVGRIIYPFSISKNNRKPKVLLCGYFICPARHVSTSIQYLGTNVFSYGTPEKLQSCEFISKQMGILCSLIKSESNTFEKLIVRNICGVKCNTIWVNQSWKNYQLSDSRSFTFRSEVV